MIASLKKIVPPPIAGLDDRTIIDRPPPVSRKRAVVAGIEPIDFVPIDFLEVNDPVNPVPFRSSRALPVIQTQPRADYISPEMFGVQSRYRVPGWLKRFASPFFVSFIVHASMLLLLMYSITSPPPAGNVITLNMSAEDSEDIKPETIDTASMSIFSLDESSFAAEPPRQSELTTTIVESTTGDMVASIAPVSSQIEVASKREGQSILKSFEGEFEAEVPRSKRAGKENTEQAKFFGIQSSGNRFVFVIDSSKSMSGRRWGRACKELWKSLDALHPDQEFFLVCFDMETHLMMRQEFPDLTMMRATEENITKVKRWTRSVRFGPRTFPMHALESALSLKPDAIYLLSDGEFHDDSRRFLRNNNRTFGEDRILRVHTPIHTIAFDSQAGAKLLQGIAVEHDGKFRFVD